MVEAAIRHVTGVIGLILLAKRRGRLAAVRPILDTLIAQGFYMGQTFYRHILEQSGEG